VGGSERTLGILVMRGNPLAVALAGALCVFTCASAAQGRKPLALNAGISVVHDSNFFRLAPDADAQAILGSGSRADTYFSLSAGLAADSGDGPSRLSVSGAIQSVMFSRFGQLDYTSLDLRARGDWRLTETLAADGQYSHGESLARFADFRTPVRNVRKIDEFKLGLRRGLREAVQLRGSLGLLRLDNSFEGSRDGDRADWYTELGPAFISRANSTLWLRVRWWTTVLIRTTPAYSLTGGALAYTRRSGGWTIRGAATPSLDGAIFPVSRRQ
jgi:hypothetical protein